MRPKESGSRKEEKKVAIKPPLDRRGENRRIDGGHATSRMLRMLRYIIT